jgi:hypothetical protein
MIKRLMTILDLIRDGFVDISDKNEKHFAAVGRFVLSQGIVDSQLGAMIKTMLNADEGAADLLVGEMRTGDLIVALRNLAAKQKPPGEILEKLEAIFKEINRLKQARDDLAHRACMVKGDTLAFHNAMVSKTEEAIAVNYYSIDELDEFSSYAAGLLFRLRSLSPALFPRGDQEQKTALMFSIGYVLLLKLAIAAVDSPQFTEDEKSQLRALVKAAREAHEIYVEAAKKIDPEFGAHRQKANQTLMEVAYYLTQMGQKIDPTSLEIPLRLQKQDHSPKKDAQSQKRLPPSSPK